MFKLWAKKIKDSKIVDDLTIDNPSTDLSRTKKIFSALDTVCHSFDLSSPIWLDSNINEFKRISTTRFNSDNFFDEIDFDYLEITVIEED